MKKVLLTLPNSIAGTLILKGYKQGFKSCGAFVMEKDARELTIDDIKRFKPDIIFGYDYGFLFNAKDEVKEYFLNNADKYRFVHYFADEPDSKYACVNQPELFEQYKSLCEKHNPETSTGGFYSFVWDRDFEKSLPRAKYLPLAVNHKAYAPSPDDFGQYLYDISFVGRPLGEKRQKILAALVRTFGKKLNIFCYEKHFLQSLDDMKERQLLDDFELDIYKSAYRGFLTTEREISRVYNNSKININITLQGISGLNYRVFEVLASRGFLLTDDMADIERNFIVSKELEVYKNIDDLVDKTEFYLKYPEFAQRIAFIGYADVIKNHTYTARAYEVLKK